MISGNANEDALNALFDRMREARDQWLDDLDSESKSAVPNNYLSGVTAGSVVARLFDTTSYINSCPVWVLEDSPIEHGLYIATNSVTSTSVSITPATSIGDSTVFIDIVSGLVITQTGDYMRNADGWIAPVDADAILSGLRSKYPSAFSDTFDTYYSDYLNKYNVSADEMIYPISFGNQTIGIYRGDAEREQYIYWSYNGSSMTDYFVTVNKPEDADLADDFSNALLAGQYNSETTQYLLSVVDGKTYSIAGQGTNFSQYPVVLDTLGPLWRTEIQNSIAALSVEFAALEASLEAEAAAQQASDSLTYSYTESDSDRKAIATALSTVSFELYPHDDLKKHPDTGKYYAVVSQDGTSDDTSHYYLDFDTPRTASDGSTPDAMALVFSGDDGTIVGADSGLAMAFDKVHTYSLRKKYGVGVTSDAQVLGAAYQHPMIVLGSDDKTITPGQDGAAMVTVSNSAFPSNNIPASITSGTKTYYFYYNLIMKTYYALCVDSDGGDPIWIGVADGTKYNADGTNKSVNNPVAVGSSLSASDGSVDSSADNNFLFAYSNAIGFAEGFFPNEEDNHAYTKFLNNSTGASLVSSDGSNHMMNSMVASSSVGNTVNMLQTPVDSSTTATNPPSLTTVQQYYVGWDPNNPTQYDVDTDSVWHYLRLMDNSSSTYQDLCVALKGDAVTYALYAGDLYATTDTASPYAMTGVLDSGLSMTLTLENDANTSVPYASVTSGLTSTVTYAYQYTFDAFSIDQLSLYHLNVWGMQTSPNSKGQTVLAQNMPTGSDGSVSLSSVSYKTIAGYDDISVAALSELKDDLDNIGFDSAASVYYLSTDSGYTRLSDGVKYDSTGVPTGGSETYDDWQALSDSTHVAVVESTDNGTVTQSLQYAAGSSS